MELCAVCTHTSATRQTMLMLKLTFSSSVTSGVGSIRGMVNNQADTYIMGAERNVLITIPDVTWRQRVKYEKYTNTSVAFIINYSFYTQTH